jgi:hypothetical protein
MVIILRKIEQPTLPAFEPPPPPCAVHRGDHNWVSPPEKEPMLKALPPSGRDIWCSYCGETRKGIEVG